MGQPKRLIEVDLPIKRISEHARREKSIRHGHISTLHIWWARRPLAACRAVICAALWLDPADPLCPQQFRDEASRAINEFARKSVSDKELAAHCSHESWNKWQKLTNSGGLDSMKEAHRNVLRFALLDFIADFSNWDNSTVAEYLETSRALTQAAHEALGGTPKTRPLVVDPFAGGGSIPLEALRIGADIFASDLNPLPVLLNKVVLEYVPKHGQGLADEVRKWGDWIQNETEKKLAEFYPTDPDGATPIAYLWARTIQCEGPGCGAEVPLIRSLWLGKKANRSVALQLVPNKKAKRVDFQIIVKQGNGWVGQDDHRVKVAEPKFDGTVKRGSATCVCCGFTTPVVAVRRQLKQRLGGARDARLFCVVTCREGDAGRRYRLSNRSDFLATEAAAKRLAVLAKDHTEKLSLVPDEELPLMSGVFNVPLYGHTTWGSIFTDRQALALCIYSRLVKQVCGAEAVIKDPKKALVRILLGLSFTRLLGRLNSLCWWRSQADQEKIEVSFSGQTIPMKWDFAEGVPIAGVTAGWSDSYALPIAVVENLTLLHLHAGTAEQANATKHPLPDDSADALITDPPYYNAIPYADLSDFYYVWLRRTLGNQLPAVFSANASPKEEEICQMSGWDPVRYSHKDARWFEGQMAKALAEGRRALRVDGIAVVVFAHKTTTGWEALLQAMINAGWIITGSWPIDTEMGSRLRARGSAALASSVHLVCRPRENRDGSVRAEEIGDWRDVLQELPRRIHDWMPRLAEEGVVGADAIFACLGPALEIFSRYRSVEKANGQIVALREYLEHVWAAVAKEALTVVFKGADASGFEEDARLTAMWLWTLFAGQSGANGSDEEADEDEESEESGSKPRGYILEYDAARKIAQGLGAHLEALPSLVEIKGETATLRSVAERTRLLFGKDESESPTKARKKKKAQLQLGFISELEQAEEAGSWGSKGAPSQGATVLDRVHQSMILFAAGRSEALRRFLVDEGVGKDERFWRLAQVLSFLYPKTSDEKRWIDGVLARKKGLGF